MTFRGLDPRTSLARWGLAAIAVGVVMGVSVPVATSGLAAAWDGNRQSIVWLVERVLGFGAYLAITGSVIYGLLLTTRLLDAIAHRPITFNLHQDLASVGVALAAVHGALLLLDHSVPFTLAQVIVPGLAPHAPLAVGVGQVAFYLAAIVTGSFYLRRRMGQRAWRTLHYLAFLAFAGATAHGIAAGSDASTPWAQLLYIFATAVVAFLLVYRIGMAVSARTTVPSGRVS